MNSSLATSPPAIASSPHSTNTSISRTTFDPIGNDLRNGIIALAYFGLLSSISTILLLVFITQRMISWRKYYAKPISRSQIFILIYNLLIADFQQAVSFLISFHWLSQGKVNGASKMCFAQGWLIQIGDLSSGLWVLAIATFTLISLVAQKSIPHRIFVGGIIGIWVFCLGLTLLGPLKHTSDFFAPAGAWCWINKTHQPERLYLHYLWIFIAQFGSIIMYAIVFFSLWRQLAFFRSISPSMERGPSPPNFSFKPTCTITTIRSNHTHDPFVNSRKRVSRAAKCMVVYPLAYVTLTLPLATARVHAMNGKDLSLSYYCVAGAMMASCGIVDVVLYIYTRKALVKSSVGIKNRPPPTLTRRSGSQRSVWRERTSTEPFYLGDFVIGTNGRTNEVSEADGIFISQSIVQSERSVANSIQEGATIERVHSHDSIRQHV